MQKTHWYFISYVCVCVKYTCRRARGSVSGNNNFFIASTSYNIQQYNIFFSTGFYSPYRTLTFLTGLLDPQTFGRTPCLGDQSTARPLPRHRTTQHRNTQTHIHAPKRFRTCDLNVQAVVYSTCLRPLDYWDLQYNIYRLYFTFSASEYKVGKENGITMIIYKEISSFLPRIKTSGFCTI
jgi:hypothetical protein